jgi:hypothetical protein
MAAGEPVFSAIFSDYNNNFCLVGCARLEAFSVSSRYHRRNRATPRVFSTSAIARLRRPPPIRLAISRPWRPVFADPARGAPRFKNPFPRFRVAGRIGLLSSSPPSEIHPDAPTVTFPESNYTDSPFHSLLEYRIAFCVRCASHPQLPFS